MSENTKEVQEFIVSPETIKARRGVFQVIIKNKGNSANTYQLKAGDSGGLYDYSFDKETVTLEAGGTATITLTVKFKKIPLAGASKVCDFTVIAIRDRRESITAKGKLECPPRFPIWALAAGGAVIIVIIVVAIVLGSKGGGSSELCTTCSATNTPTIPATTTPPSASITPTVTTPSVTPTQMTASPTPTATATQTTPTSTTTATTTTTPTLTPTPTLTATTPTIPNIAGQWHWDVTVTVAAGVCAGEEGPKPTRTITVTQQGKDVTISGFPNPEKILTGDITFDNTVGKWIIKLHGSYPEDQGTTTGDYTLTLNSTFDEMTGEENWNWVGGGGSCPGSKSIVTAERIS